MPKKLIFVRHGHTANNSTDHKENRLMGWAKDDTGLSEQGVKDAQTTAAKLTTYQIDSIYYSDLLRTSETAHIITSTLGLTGEPTHLLRERNLGNFAGLTSHEIKTTRPGDWDKFLDHHDLDWNGLEGESLRHVHERFARLLQHLHSNHTDQTILLVTHSGYLHTILRDHFEFFPKESFQEVSHSSITVLEKTISSYRLALYNT